MSHNKFARPVKQVEFLNLARQFKKVSKNFIDKYSKLCTIIFETIIHYYILCFCIHLHIPLNYFYSSIINYYNVLL